MRRTIQLLSLAVLLSACAFAQNSRLVYVILGPPGSGKTTQAEALKTKTKLPILSGLTLLKESHDRKSSMSKTIKNTAAGAGEGMNDEVINALLFQRIQKGDYTRGFILDGYPVTKTQAEYLTKLVKDGEIEVPVIIRLVISDQEARQRLSSRGKSYDKPEVVDERFAAYHAEEKVVMEMAAKNKIVDIDATKSPSEVTKAVLAVVEKSR
jgi:adenylate kinase